MAQRGKLIGLVGYVWDCGDDYCGCTEAAIEALFHNANDSRWITRERLWTGPFHTDHEGGGAEELAAMRDAMARYWPEAERRIAWGWMTQTDEWFREKVIG